MTSHGDSPVSYLCPRCQTPLTAEAQHAGKRQTCPNCGKQVKVPGTGSAARANVRQPDRETDAVASPDTHQGIANISVVCPVCGTRLYASPSQVGTTLVCPDCLESVLVPREAADRPSPPRTTSAATRPADVESAPTAPPTDADDDELKLSDPVEMPAAKFLPTELSDLIDRHASDLEAPLADAKPTPDDRPRKSPTAPVEFSVTCPVCDSRVYADEDEIGQQKPCPDCYSPVVIVRPKAKPRRKGEVNEAEYEGESFELSEPVPLDVYRRSEKETAPKTLGEQALVKAQQDFDRREREDAHLPASPLWTGLFNFLPDPHIFLRLGFATVLIAGIVKLSFATIDWANAGGAVWFLALVGTAGLVFLSVVAILFLTSTCLTIIQETANGFDKVSEWPDLNPMDWAAESLSVLLAVFYCIVPGLLIGWILGFMGVSSAVTWLLMCLGLYAFYPFVQLSILESSSLGTPLTNPILEAMRNESLLWITFYLITAGIGLAVAITVTPVSRESPFVLLVVLAGLWTFALFVYYRLLGRLAWACQVRPMLKNNDRAEDEDED